MKVVQSSSLLALALFGMASAGCASRSFNKPASGVRDTTAVSTGGSPLLLRAIPGNPMVFAMGHQEKYQSENYIDFAQLVQNPPGQPAAPQEKRLSSKLRIDVASGAKLSSSQMPGFEVPLQSGGIPYFGASYRSSAPVDCNKSLALVFGPDVVKTDDGTLCRLELNSTGAAELPYDENTNCSNGNCFSQTDYGIYISFIPVGPGEVGFPKGVPSTDYPSTEMASFKDGPPTKRNQIVDPVFVDHLKALRNQFLVQESYTNSCLMNARAWQWTDLASHYYCQLPYDSARTCYSSNLVVNRNQALLRLAKAAGGVPATADVVKATYGAMAAAFDTCFVKGEKGASPQPAGADVVKWFSNPTNAAAFKYAMFTVQFVRDFNINSENEVINKFYNEAGLKRPRRATDVWPDMSASEWPLGQPRYALIRSVQQAADAAAAASSPASSSPAAGGLAP